jgi:selenocysteine lyase/cysteine desulfurase
MTLFPDEAERQREFPVVRNRIHFAHAGVTPLPGRVAAAMTSYIQQAAERSQEFAPVLQEVKLARKSCAGFIGAHADEIALLGPTSLGLSLFANGIKWEPGDEVLCYHGDYPANVYPWLELRRRGVTVRYFEPAAPGEITPELVAESITSRTRLVALASCHYFTGYRIDIDAIGQLLHAEDILFSVDAIQTLGAFPLSVAHIDFLSADAHKWLLGPMAIGIVYIKKKHFELVRPTLLGAWNVESPHYLTQDEIVFVPTAQRYEPGALNFAGIYGLRAAIELLETHGIDRVAARILELKEDLVEKLCAADFEIIGDFEGPYISGITTFRHPTISAKKLAVALENAQITASLRFDRQGRDYIRFSPHFYNSEEEIDRALAAMLRAE